MGLAKETILGIKEDLMNLAKEVMQDLGINNMENINIHCITEWPKTLTGDNKLDYVLNEYNIAGWVRDTDNVYDVYILPYKYYTESKIKKEMPHVVAHELRHAWQFVNNFEMADLSVNYENRAEEIDANDYAKQFLTTRKRNNRKGLSKILNLLNI